MKKICKMKAPDTQALEVCKITTSKPVVQFSLILDNVHISIFLRDVPPAKSRSNQPHLRETPGGLLKDVVTRGVDKLLGE